VTSPRVVKPATKKAPPVPDRVLANPFDIDEQALRQHREWMAEHRAELEAQHRVVAAGLVGRRLP